MRQLSGLLADPNLMRRTRTLGSALAFGPFQSEQSEPPHSEVIERVSSVFTSNVPMLTL